MPVNKDGKIVRRSGRPRQRGTPIKLNREEELIVRKFLQARRHYFSNAVTALENQVGQPDTDWPEKTIEHYLGMLSTVLYLEKTLRHALGFVPRADA